MKLKEAFDIVNQICSDYKGTLREHKYIQTALKTIGDNLNRGSNEKEKKDVS